MAVSSFVNYIKSLPDYSRQIVHVERLPSQGASYGELIQPLHQTLEAALRAAELYPLYSHQAAAVDMASLGENVMVVTAAASGKTLCYNLPVLQSMLTEKGSRRLYVFPTKALAPEQLRSLRELVSLLPSPIHLATFDGDTPAGERSQIKKSARIWFTNPDILPARH